MNDIYFDNQSLPLYHYTESVTERDVHSEISHWHDGLEIIVVNKGSLICHTGGSPFELLSGDICLINRRQLHRIQMTDLPENHQVLIIGSSLLMQNHMIYEKYFQPMMEDAAFTHIRFAGDASCAAHIKEEIKILEGALQQQEIGYELDVLSSLFRLGKYLYLAYKSECFDASVDTHARIQQKMAEYIYAHYGEDLSLESIAGAGNISRSQASKLFRKYTGLSPVVYLNRHRLEMAQHLLRSTGESIAAIALACGFTDQSYFSRLFMREYGITPLQYRKGGKSLI